MEIILKGSILHYPEFSGKFLSYQNSEHLICYNNIRNYRTGGNLHESQNRKRHPDRICQISG